MGGMMGGGGEGGGGGGGGGTPILSDIAAIYSATEQKKAANHAIDAQRTALLSTRRLMNKELDPNFLDNIAVDFDKRRLERRNEFLKENDPELYQLRELSKKQLLDQANRPKEVDQSHILANKLFSEIRNEDPRMAAIKDSLLTNAETALKSGAQLPPEFQAELVRSGLNAGSQAGIGFSKNAIGGGIARLLGTAGEQLRQQRVAEATNSANAAQNLTSARTNILATVFPRLRDLETADRNESVQNYALSQANAPEIGISGYDAVNAHLRKLDSRVNSQNQYANLRGQRGFANANANSAIAGASANLVGSIISLAAGGMPMGGGSRVQTDGGAMTTPTASTGMSGLGFQTNQMNQGGAGGGLVNYINNWQ